MIKLDKYSDAFREEYFDKYWKLIEKSIDKNCNDFQKYFNISYQNNVVNKEFFKEILTCPINELIDKYDCIRNYHNIAFIVSLNMSEVLKNLDIRKFSIRKMIRKEYLNRYDAEDINTGLGKWTYRYISDNHITIDNICSSTCAWEKYRKYIQIQYEKQYSFLNGVFSYELLDRNIKGKIVKDLDVSVCPYCNRQYINNIVDDREERATADLDHFYSKSVFYLWQMSLYNYIPSCKICNSLFKSQINMDTPYLYMQGYGDNATFDLRGNSEIMDINDLFGWNDNGEIYLKYNGDNKQIDKIKREVKLFRIEALYTIHKSYANQLRYKKRVLETQMMNWTIDALLDVGKKSVIDKTKLIKMILYGVDVDTIDCKNYPLGKLIKDILKE